MPLPTFDELVVGRGTSSSKKNAANVAVARAVQQLVAKNLVEPVPGLELACAQWEQQGVQKLQREWTFRSPDHSSGSGRGGSKALRAFDGMVAAGGQPTAGTYKILIDALAKGGQWQHAQEYQLVSSSMQSRNKRLLLITVYHTVVAVVAVAAVAVVVVVANHTALNAETTGR
jgi:hypothetical protein